MEKKEKENCRKTAALFYETLGPAAANWYFFTDEERSQTQFDDDILDRKWTQLPHRRKYDKIDRDIETSGKNKSTYYTEGMKSEIISDRHPNLRGF